VKERPILFSGDMVNAILSDRKTQTRRVVKPQPSRTMTNHFVIPQPNAEKAVAHFMEIDAQGIHKESLTVRCPYGCVGDRLWVRETFALALDTDGDEGGVFAYKADNPTRVLDSSYSSNEGEYSGIAGNTGWKPSIHMPRWASRITLEITEIRVERLNDISEIDAQAEGVSTNECFSSLENCIGCKTRGERECINEWRNYLGDDDSEPCYTAKDSFISLWDSINEKRGFGWETNPFVWVISFKKVLE
jgi:hypothetical protein